MVCYSVLNIDYGVLFLTIRTTQVVFSKLSPIRTPVNRVCIPLLVADHQNCGLYDFVTLATVSEGCLDFYQKFILIRNNLQRVYQDRKYLKL